MKTLFLSSFIMTIILFCSSSNKVKKQHSREFHSWISVLDSVLSKEPPPFLKNVCMKGVQLSEIVFPDSLQEDTPLGIRFLADSCLYDKAYAFYIHSACRIDIYHIDSVGYYDSAKAYMSQAMVLSHELAHSVLLPTGLSIESQHDVIKTEIEFPLVEVFFPWIKDSLSLMYEHKKFFAKSVAQFKKRHFRETGKRFQSIVSLYIESWREQKRIEERTKRSVTSVFYFYFYFVILGIL